MATTLKVGSRGESVKSLQKKLGIKADGIFGKQTDAAVKAYQSKNSLTSDGIVGAKTNAKLSGGSSSSSTGGMSKSNTNMSSPQVGGSNFSKYLSTLPKNNANYSSSNKATSKSNSPLGMLASFFKDSISTIGKDNKKNNVASAGNIFLGNEGDYQIIPPDMRKEYNPTPYTPPTPFEAVTSFGGQILDKTGNVLSKIGDKVVDTLSSKTIYNASDYDVPSNTTLSSGDGLNPDLTGDGNLNTTTSGTSTLDNTETQTDTGITTFGNGANPAIINANNNANSNFGVNSSSLNDPWITKVDKNEFQGADIIKYADTAARGFTSQDEAIQHYNTPQGLASIKPFLDKGGKVEDIIKKVQTVTNGIVGPQSFTEFEQKLNDLDPTNKANVDAYINSKLTGFNATTLDTKGVPSELKGVIDAKNKELVMQSNYLNEREKMLYDQSAQDLLTAQEERNALQKITDARETAIERKVDIATRQYKADMKAEESETEMNRITARKNLTEFLAQIGALRTDGNAQLGIETLDQKYQAQKTAIRSKYTTLIGNAQAEADEKISDLQYNLKMNTLELYKDLNKTDREIRMETMKMKYEYESDVLKANTSYQDKLSDLKIKNSKENSDLSRDVLKLQTEILSNDPSIGISLAKQLASEYLGANPTDRSISTIAGIGNKTKMTETEPKFTGESLKITPKIEKGFIDKGGDNSQLIKVQNLLNEGWSLQQIAKNTNMPNDLYNYLSGSLTINK